MHPALWRLIRLQNKAKFRRMVAGVKTLKGAVLFFLMVGFTAMWLVPSIVVGVMARPSDPETVRSFLAPGLLMYCLISLITMGPDSGVFFLPAEVDFLFPGPFRRRELLLYRLTSMAFSSLIIALMFSVFLLQHVSHWVAGYVGSFLALAFVILVQTGVALVVSLVAEQAYTRTRKIVLIVVGTVLVAALAGAIAASPERGVVDVLRRLRASWLGLGLLAPFEVLARTITARNIFPELAGWGALALVIDAALVAFVLRLDANFLEHSITASQKVYERLQRARRGAALMTFSKSSARWRLPVLPWLGGAGPLAWRQLTTALRTARGLLIVLSIIGIAMLAPLLLAGHESGATWAGLSAVVMMTVFLLPQLLQYDFRGDIDRLDVLKTLPTSPMAVTVGQLAAPVIFTTLLQFAILVPVAALQFGITLPVVAAIAILPSANLFIFGLENLVFLLYPFRAANVGAGDFQAFSRHMLVQMIKMLALGVAVGVSAGIGGLAWFVSGQSRIAFAAGIWLSVTGLALALLPLVTFAFQRLDPPLDLS